MEFSYPSELPITPFIPEISALLAHHQVLVVAGDTGSGKTTQLPKICLDLHPDHTGLIGCTQPRRIAATTVAQRVKEELQEHGNLVGWKIRFHDQTTKNTRIKFMTDGVLLAETRQDPLLNRYRIIIVDEAHERNLNIDFLLGYLHRLLRKRTDLQLIITSATIDTAAFAKHFHNAPILQITGKTHPVQIIYQEPAETEDEDGYVDRCVEAAASICTSYPPGDILVFLPTEKDIRSCCETLRGRIPQRLILPLFGRLQAADQQQIFRDQQKPKIVVASNVAETSLTVPGIRYVIDSGLARIAGYNSRSRTMSLPITAISQANCDQRAGRCGRIGPGICFRLYSEEDYLNRPQFPIPEIQRANLAEVILQMVALKLGDPVAFPFLDPPKPSAIREGYKMLLELGALSESGRLTPHGTIMAQLPIDPVISRIIIEAAENQCLKEIVIIAAALAIQDPRVRPADKERLADEAHASFQHPHSDFIMLLTIWDRCHEAMEAFSWSALKRFCTANFLSFQRMREWLDLHEQLSRLLRDRHRFQFNVKGASYEALHRSLLAGLFRQCARKKEGALYQGIANREMIIFPGSHQHAKSGTWIMAGSFIETSRLFALTVATIEPEWIERAAKHFCSYNWSNPRWQKKTGQVVADETVSLYGLILISGRRVNFSRRDKKNLPEARRIFIQQALVAGEISGSFSFLEHNEQLLARWREAEARLRKRDVVVDDAVIHDFYDSRLPAAVCDRQSLIKALKRDGHDRLLMAETDILLRAPGDRDLLDYPPSLQHGSIEIDLSYCFEPGSDQDGVTACLPDHLLDSLKPDHFDWLVPGLLPEKTAFLLKGLPKRIRKQLIPISDAVDRLLDDMEIGHGNYLSRLSTSIFKLFGLTIRQEEWPTTIPDHLRMRFVIIDQAGNEISAGRDLQLVRESLRGASARRPPGRLHPDDQKSVDQLATTVFQSWDFAAIKERLPLYDDQNRIIGFRYAALCPLPDHHGVGVIYCNSLEEARSYSEKAAYLLFRQGCRDQYKQVRRYLKTALSGPSSIWLTATLGSTTKALEAISDFILRSLFTVDFDLLTEPDEYFRQIDQICRKKLFASGRRLIDSILALLRHRQEITEFIRKNEKHGVDWTDMYRHLEMILPAEFLDRFQAEDLDLAGRYLKGLAVRTERASHNPRKDEEKQQRFIVHLGNVERYRHAWSVDDEPCRLCYRRYYRLVAELGISLFSPEIKTTEKVSEKVVNQAWSEVMARCPSSLRSPGGVER